MGRVKKSFNEKYNSPFAANMRELMKEYGVTQDTLAAKIGRTRQTVCQYVNGDSEPGYETLAKIADFFSVSTDYLLGISLAKTPGTTMQAVTEYTGLSEDNVLRLHQMQGKKARGAFETPKDGTVIINGGEPYLDFLNDILDAVYAGKETFVRDYILLCYYAEWLRSGETTVKGQWKTRIPVSQLIESYSTRITRAIEKYLVAKYTATDGQVE